MTGFLPFTPQQEQLYATELLRPGTGRNNVPLLIALDGPVDVAALERAIRRAAARQPSLRTRVGYDDEGDPGLELADTATPLVVLSGAPAGDVADFCQQPLGDLAEALVRFWWWPAGEEASVLLAVAHHLVMDGASGPVLVGELAAAYAAETGGAPAEPPPAGDHTAYAVERAAAALRREPAFEDDHWAEALRALPTEPLLPRSPQRTRGSCGFVVRRIDPGTAAALRQTARARQASPAALYTAALAGQLAASTGRDDILIGVPFDHRLPEYDHTVGMFVDVLPLRVRVPDPRDAPVLGLLPATRDGLLDLLENGETSSARIFRLLRLRAPIEVTLSVRSSWRDVRTVGATTWTVREMRLPQAPYPCSLDLVDEQDGSTTLTLYHRRDHLADDEAARLADGVLERLTGCVDGPDGKVR